MIRQRKVRVAVAPGISFLHTVPEWCCDKCGHVQSADEETCYECGSAHLSGKVLDAVIDGLMDDLNDTTYEVS